MFNFSKRLNRKTFIVRYILSFIITVTFLIGIDILFNGVDLANNKGNEAVIAAFFALMIFWIALIRQRSNDITERYALLVTVIASLTPAFLALAIWPGMSGPNKYGK